MSGLVGGNVRVRVPVGLDPAAEAHSNLRSRAAELLAREPFLAFVLALDALVLTIKLPDLFVGSDTWLALVGGRQVWSGGLPRHDTMTIWSQGATWVDQQWLGQLLFYGIHALGGLRLLLLVVAALLVGAFALALTFARRTAGSSRSVALVGVVGLFVAFPSSAVRTQALAYPLFISLFWLLAADARKPTRRVFIVLPLLILWANAHGSAALGAGLVVVWGLTELIRAGRRPGAGRARARAIVLAVAAPLCLLASPYALSLPGYYRDVLGAGAFRDVVSEWGPTTFPDHLPFFVLALPALWLAGRKARRLSLFEHVALICMLLAGLDAVRNMVWFAFVAVMVVPRALDGVWPVKQAPFRRRVNLALSFGALAVLVGAFAAIAARPGGRYSPDYPRRAADAVARATAGDSSLRVFANERYADWLLWRVPKLSGRVAFDARFELLSSRQLRAISHFRNHSSADWLAAADGYRLLVLDPEDEKRAIRVVLHEAGTRQLYRDRHVAVLLRKGQP
jgi:hypothetical protein